MAYYAIEAYFTQIMAALKRKIQLRKKKKKNKLANIRGMKGQVIDKRS